MSYFLKLDIFFFNAKTDFLPYYKTLNIKVDEESTLLDLLKNEIVKIEKGCNLPKNKNLAVKVNNVVVFLDTPIKKIVEKLNSKNLTIEPISEYRATHDLDINTDDFYKKLELFDGFIDEDDKKYYEKLISYHYASVALEHEQEYFGDSLFILADKLIKKNPENKRKILAIIANEKFGIWLHTNIKNILFDDNKADEIENIIKKLRYDIVKTIPDINKFAKLKHKHITNLQ
jgi:succinate dehydrogenase/fumarate reductase-like Fe-S protein